MNTKKIALAIFAIPLLFTGCNGPTFTEPSRPQINQSMTTGSNYNLPMTVGSQQIFVEKVDTDQARQQGLSGRENLEDGQGMLFDFTNTVFKQPSFWMKDMKFAIDIIWIKDARVIGITPNVQPPSNLDRLSTYSSPGDITHVLEVPSGSSERNGIEVGDMVSF